MWRVALLICCGRRRRDGSWDEPQFTGTGFPRVFYLLYHMYRQYFPLIALTTYGKVMAGQKACGGLGSARIVFAPAGEKTDSSLRPGMTKWGRRNDKGG